MFFHAKKRIARILLRYIPKLQFLLIILIPLSIPKKTNQSEQNIAKHKTRSGPAQQPFEWGWQEGDLNMLLEHETISMDLKTLTSVVLKILVPRRYAPFGKH